MSLTSTDLLAAMCGTPIPLWHVLLHIRGNGRLSSAEGIIARFNRRRRASLEVFAPMYEVQEHIDGKDITRNLPLTYFYVFVKGNFADIRELCLEADNGFSFLINHSSEKRYATVDDERMEAFRRIASAYGNRLPVRSFTTGELEAGDVVEIIGGDFPGITGIFRPEPRSKHGYLLIPIAGNAAVSLQDVRIDNVRIIKFSQNAKRAYDHIDALARILLEAIRYISANATLSPELTRQIEMQSMRLSGTKIPHKKTEAKLLAMLAAARALLLDRTGADSFAAQYIKFADSITNKWTVAFTELMAYVATGNRKRLQRGAEAIAGDTPQSALQRSVAEQYRCLCHTPQP